LKFVDFSGHTCPLSSAKNVRGAIAVVLDILRTIRADSDEDSAEDNEDDREDGGDEGCVEASAALGELVALGVAASNQEDEEAKEDSHGSEHETDVCHEPGR
jgi:hypothetical protein